MKLRPLWDQLRDDALGFGADVVILDTVSDIYGGSEIERGPVTAFVKGCLGRLGKEIGGTIIALAHPSLAGKASGEGYSGSTAWNNAVRSRLYLRYPGKATTGDIRELVGMKTNYGPKGNLLKLRWNAGAFDVIAGSSPATNGRNSPIPSIEEKCAEAVLSVLMAHPGEHLVLNKPNSSYLAQKVLKRLKPDLLAPFNYDEVGAALNRLFSVGKIREEVVGRNSSRRPIPGLIVTYSMSEYDVFG